MCQVCLVKRRREQLCQVWPGEGEVERLRENRERIVVSGVPI